MLFLSIELLELSLDPGIFAFVMIEMSFSALIHDYNSSWILSNSVVSVRLISAFLASKAFSKASLICLKDSVSFL